MNYNLNRYTQQLQSLKFEIKTEVSKLAMRAIRDYADESGFYNEFTNFTEYETKAAGFNSIYLDGDKICIQEDCDEIKLEDLDIETMLDLGKAIQRSFDEIASLRAYGDNSYVEKKEPEYVRIDDNELAEVGMYAYIDGESSFCDGGYDRIIDILYRYDEETGDEYKVIKVGSGALYRLDDGSPVAAPRAYSVYGIYKKK